MHHRLRVLLVNLIQLKGSIGDDQQQSKSSDGTQEGGTAKAKTGTTSSSDSGKPEKDPLKNKFW